MLTGIHFLLTYTCLYECDHCFVHSAPGAEGTFTVGQLRDAIEQARELDSVEWVYFEGGEPFLFYPLLLEGVAFASRSGFKVGIVTNGYFGVSEADATLWLRPLVDLGVADLSVSDDLFHQPDADNPARRTLRSAGKLGIPSGTICVEKPAVATESAGGTKGEPVTGGSVMFRGRAAHRLTEGLPRRPWREFTECPHEELASPQRVHVDPFGYVHLCQGLVLGNIRQRRLAALMNGYAPNSHPIAKPLLEGGPARLAEEHGVVPDVGYVDACHFCYLTRLALVERFPEFLAPRQCYGLTSPKI